MPRVSSLHPWVDHYAPCTAPTLCHRHGRIGVHSGESPGSVLEKPVGDSLFPWLMS